MSPTGEPRRDERSAITVHEATRRPGPFMDYADQVSYGASTSNLTFRYSLNRLARFDIDVIHTRSTGMARLLGPAESSPEKRLTAVRDFLEQMQSHRVALVQTLTGNVWSGDTDDETREARRLINAATSRWVSFDESTSSPDKDRTTVIRVAHYRERFKGYPRAEAQRGSIVVCLTPQSPSRVVGLAGVPRATETPGLTMRLIGEPTRAVAGPASDAARRPDRTVSTRFEKMSDASLLAELGAAELVIQPRLATFEDWQTTLVALSLDRPVLLPDEPAARRLARNVGPGWIHVHGEPTTAAAVDSALSAYRADPPANGPDLSLHDPASVGEAYAGLFHAASAESRLALA